MLQITDTLAIDDAEIAEAFIHASGPGGQNVNKVATAVQIRFDAAHSPALPETVRARLLRLASQYLTKDGVVIITARQFRTQAQNRQDARAQLAALIERSTHAPVPHLQTRPTLASKVRRLEGKRKRSATKQGRGARDYRED